MATKRCSRCGETKSVREFGKNKSRKDGLQDWCKVCHNAQSREAKSRLVIDPTSGEETTAGNAQSQLSKSRLVISPRTGALITANSAAKDKHFSQSTWHKLRKWISDETNRLIKQLAQGKGTDKACLKLFGADREECLKHFNKQLASRNWSWQDYLGGGIEIDHRVPLCVAASDTELRTLALLPNVQLLTTDENRIKAIADKLLAA